MGEHHWTFLLHVINETVKKVTKCPWTDCNNKGLKKIIIIIIIIIMPFSPEYIDGSCTIAKPLIISVNKIKRFVLVTVTQCVYCEEVMRFEV
jgi:hypothetical protein